MFLLGAVGLYIGAVPPSETAPEALKRRIRGEGFRLGFSAVGFAPPRLPEAGARFRAWLAAGRQGTMKWMERAPERRSGEAGPGAGERTVIVCALNYYAGEPAAAPPGGGVISQYARGEDYHRVLRRKLRRLARFGERQAVEAGLLEAPSKAGRRRIPVLVDYGPLLEKAYGERAGVGWIGKHSNLIRTEGSSWFFLGEILFPLALPADESHPGRCGSCVRCIEACPTEAIVAPYIVDSRRCISYLTIELRGAIPTEFRRAIGDRIFGCDDCQDVCPWNRFAAKTKEPAFAPGSASLHTETLAALLRLGPEEFRERTRRSAVRRAGYAGFLRNVAVALGNQGGREAFAALVPALEHPEPLVRGHAAWGLAEADPAAAPEVLAARLDREDEEEVRTEIREALDRARGRAR